MGYGGRPTLFKEEYCDMLIEHMAKGFSFETFGATVNVGMQTLYDWKEKFPQFSDAKNIGHLKGLEFWENAAITGLFNQSETHEDGKTRTVTQKSLNGHVWSMNMKNRYRWRDRMEQEITSEKPIQIVLNDKPEEPDPEDLK